MITAKLNDIFYYNCELVEVVAINEGHRSIIFQPLIAERCPCCGEIKQYNVIEQSPNFQNGAKPVPTISER
jgi:hypothetical protein